jgi:hypothetical protein
MATGRNQLSLPLEQPRLVAKYWSASPAPVRLRHLGPSLIFPAVGSLSAQEHSQPCVFEYWVHFAAVHKSVAGVRRAKANFQVPVRRSKAPKAAQAIDKAP